MNKIVIFVITSISTNFVYAQLQTIYPDPTSFMYHGSLNSYPLPSSNPMNYPLTNGLYFDKLSFVSGSETVTFTGTGFNQVRAPLWVATSYPGLVTDASTPVSYNWTDTVNVDSTNVDYGVPDFALSSQPNPPINAYYPIVGNSFTPGLMSQGITELSYTTVGPTMSFKFNQPINSFQSNQNLPDIMILGDTGGVNTFSAVFLDQNGDAIQGTAVTIQEQTASLSFGPDFFCNATASVGYTLNYQAWGINFIAAGIKNGQVVSGMQISTDLDIWGIGTLINPVPEPCTTSILGLGIAAIAYRKRRKKSLRQVGIKKA